jgi:aspartokinase-like uncharacterized kinase
MRSLVQRHPALSTAVVTGRGSFVGVAAAQRLGLQVRRLSSRFGADGARSAPAVAVAMLCERAESESSVDSCRIATGDVRMPPPALDVVVKIGGGSLQTPSELDAALAILDRTTSCSILVVPGGGPFADAVRQVDNRMRLTDQTAHWMAIRAMDVFAELLAARLGRAVLVRSPEEVVQALAGGRLPVLAPFEWLRRADPLPHTWDVTSDSIAAWVAQALAVPLVILLKPTGARGTALTDAFLASNRGCASVALISVDETAKLQALLHARASGV